MKLTFVINYRLDSPSRSNIRHAELVVPNAKSRGSASKDRFLLLFCREIASFCQDCRFYKDVQVMAQFLERPIRIKYIVRLSDDICLVLDVSFKDTDLKRKASELKNHFEIANEQNRSNLNLKYPVLLIPQDIGSSIQELENEYRIRIMTLEAAVVFVKGLMKNAKSD